MNYQDGIEECMENNVKLLEYIPTQRHCSLLAYDIEREKHPLERKMLFRKTDSERLIKALSIFFKVSIPEITYYSGLTGCYYPKKKKIKLSINENGFVNYAMTIHEFAHHLSEWRRKKRVGHRVKFMNNLEKVYDVANHLTYNWDFILKGDRRAE